MLLAADTFGWPAQLPRMDAGVLQALLAATTLMQLTGPLWTVLGLRQVAGEIERRGGAAMPLAEFTPRSR